MVRKEEILHLLKTRLYIIITCNVCGYLNSPTAVFCENCGSELSDSPDLDVFDDDDEW